MCGMKFWMRVVTLTGWMLGMTGTVEAAEAGSTEASSGADQPLPTAPGPQQTRRIQRLHRAGMAGMAMVGAGVPLLIGGTAGINAAVSRDPVTDILQVHNPRLLNTSVYMVVGGTLSTIGGEITWVASNQMNGHLLHKLDPHHSRTAGWASLAGYPVLFATLDANPPPSVAGMLIGTGVVAVVGGQGLQFAQNLRTARALGVFPKPKPRVHSLRLQPTPQGVLLAGRF